MKEIVIKSWRSIMGGYFAIGFTFAILIYVISYSLVGFFG